MNWCYVKKNSHLVYQICTHMRALYTKSFWAPADTSAWRASSSSYVMWSQMVTDSKLNLLAHCGLMSSCSRTRLVFISFWTRLNCTTPSLVPRPTCLWFVLTVILGSGRVGGRDLGALIMWKMSSGWGYHRFWNAMHLGKNVTPVKRSSLEHLESWLLMEQATCIAVGPHSP